jgi:hypothetical protein
MNFIDTTAGSTHATNVAIQLYMPPAEAATTLAICDRMQALEAEVLRLTPKPDHARACRTADIEDLVLLALTNATLLAAVMAVHHCFRITKVIDHLYEYRDRYQIAKPPCRKTVGEILLKHGY